MQLAEDVYELTRSFPREEAYGLTSQLRRAAVGIPSHVAEGHQQGTRAYAHFVMMAAGSQAELETQLELTRRIGLVAEASIAPIQARAAEVGRLLHGLLRSLNRRINPTPSP